MYDTVLTKDQGIEFLSGAFASLQVPDWHSQVMDESCSKLDQSSLLNVSGSMGNGGDRQPPKTALNL